jgi:hypothetical protein
MYARLVRFSFGPGKQAEAESLADTITPLITAQPGCKGVTVFGDDNGECGIFVLWNSEAEANAAAQVVRPKLDEHLVGKIQAQPDARLFKVLSS